MFSINLDKNIITVKSLSADIKFVISAVPG